LLSADIESMLETDIQTCSQTITAPVNVLFADCESSLVDALRPRLLAGRLSWDTVAFSELALCLENRHIIGAVVFGKTVCAAAQPEQLSFLLKTLQQQGVAAFFLTYGPPATNDHHLVTVIAPETEHELPARLETAVQYAKQRHHAQADRRLHEDTAEQLEMAGQVQRNFLPSRLPHTDRIRWAAMFRPAQWVSGDIYDITRLDESHIGFYLADAVGHSMPAALLTIFLKQATVMRQTMGNHYRIFEPDEVIANLNRRMTQQDFNGCLFATCCYGLLNIQTFELKLARAGHPYAILIRDNTPTCLQSRGGLLGVFEQAQFEKQTVQLRSGDKLFVYSDGGESLVGNAKDDGGFYFTKGFTSLCCLPVDQMIRTFDEIARHHHFRPGELDDVTAIGLEIL